MRLIRPFLSRTVGLISPLPFTRLPSLRWIERSRPARGRAMHRPRKVDKLWSRPERSEWFGGGYDYPGIHSICVDPRNSRHVTIAISAVES